MAKQEYPKVLWGANGEQKLVQDALQHQQAGPGWYDHPDEAKAAKQKPAPAPKPETPPASTGGGEPDAERDAKEAKALYAAPVGRVLESLKDADAETLKRLRGLEEKNPNGPRKTLVEGLDVLLKEKDTQA